MTESTTEQLFLQRWSKLKRQIQPLEPAQAEQSAAETLSTAAQPNAEPISSENPAKPFEQLTDADMPALDSLDEHSDYRPFFAPNVSAVLRRLALRKLFHQPVFNIRDGLCEYDGDYTRFEPLGNIVTADMKFMQELAERRERERAEALAEADEPESGRISEAATAPEESTPGEQTDEQTAEPQQGTT